ncbi:UDP-N-acetylmuramate dehydrogenase [Bacillus infantis]|uniref:UDP-N-acetylmuramate dehydrogenase n=1 Tax=Bacillus infantis TaxID=324767 RepID=UPI00101B6B5F|nr:UDP-N-acetylmuramate dehydrogenase [Bacillus infantis]RYI29614.1 UDP-N-acetylmuramate dehydrogenase [Bacillus infantis]
MNHMLKNLYELLSLELPDSSFRRNEPLKEHAYTKLGGPADLYAEAACPEDAAYILKQAKRQGVPVTLIGNGSNMIIRDGGIRGLVLSLSKMNKISVTGETVIAEAGSRIIDVSLKALEHSLSGMEFACGIPGTTGGALYMNAGAYGGQISDVLQKTLVLTEEGSILELGREKLVLSYRKSIMAEKKFIILKAEFNLSFDCKEDISARIKENTEARKSKQPLEFPSCGSVFKRPPGHYAGKLIQDSGLQGKNIGGAEVSRKHAGFIINKDNCTAKDYLALIEYVRKTVKEKHGVDLETEVITLGEELYKGQHA